jgi:hypothetical protein
MTNPIRQNLSPAPSTESSGPPLPASLKEKIWPGLFWKSYQRP